MEAKRLIIRVLSLLILLCTAGYIINYYRGINEAEKKVSHIRNVVRKQEVADTVVEEGQKREIITYADNGMMNKYYPLYQQNNDLTGWLYVKGTNIDYPVMYRNDGNDFYMTRGFDKNKRSGGMLFLDYECSINESDNLIIYGHNMNGGTMFHELSKYKSKDFFEENGYIHFDTLYRTGIYRVIGAMHVRVKDNFPYYAFIKAQTPEEFDNYVKKVKELSIYDTGETAVLGDRLLTLSTCSYNTKNERFVVVAKWIGE